jgi:type II secretory pathway pseudopilin PulG
MRKIFFLEFSLIEMLMAIAVIATLMALLLPVLSKCQQRARALAKYSSCMTGRQSKTAGRMGHWTFGEGGGSSTMDWATGQSSPTKPFIYVPSSKAEWQNFSPASGDWSQVPFSVGSLPSWSSLENSLRGSEYSLWAQTSGYKELTNTDNLAKIPSQLSVEIWFLIVEDGVEVMASMGPEGYGGSASWFISAESTHGMFTAYLRLASGGTLYLTGDIDPSKANPPNVPIASSGTYGNFLYRWTHIVFTYDANKDFKLYVNGVLNTAKKAAGEIRQPTGNPWVGAGPGKVLISELVIYDRILDSGEISLNYNMGKPSSYKDEAP